MEQKLERLQKVMAEAGIASRRKCEDIISSGRVIVNGSVITELGYKVSKKDLITVDGKSINKEEKVYYVLNKPTGYVTTVSDDLGRKTVMALFSRSDLANRIYPIGRLDYDTSGVILFTNDGDLSYILTKSNLEVEKVYQIRCDGIITQDAVNKLIRGVTLDGVLTKRASVEIVSMDRENKSTLLLLKITEGKNRQVRRMMEEVGFNVKKLKRISFAGITLDDLVEGAYRPLKPHEIKVLFSLKKD